MLNLIFCKGALVFYNLNKELLDILNDYILGLHQQILHHFNFKHQDKIIVYDERTKEYKCPAIFYFDIIMYLHNNKYNYIDNAKSFSQLSLQLKQAIEPRFYQLEALKEWQKNINRGLVVLPTGAGKTIFAIMCIISVQRNTIIHVPTLELMYQWKRELEKFLGVEIGLLGDGNYLIKDITVATYKSALIHVEKIANCFGFVIFDECHHLPSNEYMLTAYASLAPFRLGLTATPERLDGGHDKLNLLCGKKCYEVNIQELSGKTLSTYEIVKIAVCLTDDEAKIYTENRQLYLDFLRKHCIKISGINGWQKFIQNIAKYPNGKEIFKAYLTQKKMTENTIAKEAILWELLIKHRTERVLIFTQNNAMAYKLGQKYCIAVISHKTKAAEREYLLNSFREGKIRFLLTSKILNEGIDVPEANIAIVLAGSATVREHVQRLGRILRAKEGKHAIFYEVITEGTGEEFVSERRRQHDAYQGFT